jgi:hypothetical protein
MSLTSHDILGLNVLECARTHGQKSPHRGYRFLGDGAMKPKMHVADPQGYSGFGGRFLLVSRRSSPTLES